MKLLLPDRMADNGLAGTFTDGWNSALDSIELPQPRTDGGEDWLKGWNQCAEVIKNRAMLWKSIAELEKDYQQALDSLKHLREERDRDKLQILDTIRTLTERIESGNAERDRLKAELENR